MKLPGKARLVWRLYAIGVVQLLLVAAAALLIGIVVAKLPPRWDMQSLSARLTPLTRRPRALTDELTRLRREQGLLISLYDAERGLIGSNVDPPLRAPPWGANPSFNDGPPPMPPPPAGGWHRDFPHEHEHEHGHEHGHLPEFPSPFGEHGSGRPPAPETYARFSINGQDGVLVVRFAPPQPSPLPALLTLASGLLVVGVGALLTARWIARPLESLARTAIALGGGALHTRAGFTRRDEIGEVGRAFDHMADRIQTLLQTEKELLANVAHELRTPLARIRVALEIAGEGDAEVARASLHEIAVDLAELEALLDDVLSAARLQLTNEQPESVQLVLRSVEASPLSIAERALARFRAQHPERICEPHFAPDLPTLRADPVLLRRVLDNLLENAHKYAPDASLAILLNVSARDGYVSFEVVDRGMGISPEDLSRVFDAFFRSERSRTRSAGGVGLGLTLAKRIVEAHGGTISVTSTKGSGTSVRALIPALPGTH